jgi:RIO-like serine/threonine protein kinase
MKIERYIWCIAKANKFCAQRVGAKQLNHTELRVIYAIRKLATSTHSTITQLLRQYQNIASENRVSYALKHLREMDLITKTNNTYALSPSGREFLALMRRYFLNIR